MNWIYDRRKSQSPIPIHDDQTAVRGILNHWRNDLKWHFLMFLVKLILTNCQVLN